MSFAAFFIPDFALQALLRHTPELRALPVALIPENSPHPSILQATAAAQQSGVAVGMTPSQGLARCRELKIKTASRTGENSASAALFDYAWSLSRFVEQTAPGICTIALDAAQRPPHPCAAWLEGLARLNLTGRLGIAPNPDLALLAAQSAETSRTIQTADELGEVPVEILDPSPEIAAILHQWGIRTLSEFVRLGREQLVERLGPGVLPLFDRAAGDIIRPLRCTMPPESFNEEVEFENDIETLEPLLFILRRFLDQLTARLEMIYRVVSELTLRLGMSNQTEYVRLFKVPAPTNNSDVLFRVLHTHLESFRADDPIISLRLSATPARPARQQFGLFETALRDPNQFYETLARLTALVGNDRIGTVTLEPTHRPDAFRFSPEYFSPARSNDHLPNSSGGNDLRLATGLQLRRFRPPIPATVHATPQGPIFIQSPEATGAIIDHEGPMHLSGDWWCEPARAWSRREWDIQLRDGPLCRIYEETRTRTWFLEGIYD
jgi:protein ImuB